MNKLTKLLSVFIIAGAVGTGIAGVAGCKKDKGHSHSYDYTQITGNDDQHSVHCNNGGCDKPDFLQDHTWGKDDKCVCGATKPAEAAPTVTSITVSAAGNVKQVAVESKLQLTPTVSGTGNYDNSVTWTSSDDTKATVSATGEVTGVAEGSVTITATSKANNAVSGSITLTVVAKGTVVEPGPGPTDKSLYEQLLANDNVRVSIDTEAAAGTHLAAYEVATAGIYVNGQEGYAAETHVEYAEESGVKVLKQVTTRPNVTGAPNVYTIINPGPVKGEVEGVFTTKVSKLGNNGDMIVFNGNSNVNIAMDSNGVLKCSYTNGEKVEKTVEGVKLEENKYIEVYFKLNLTEGKVTIKINGKTALDEEATGTKVFNYVQISSSNKGQRIHTTKDVVICGTVKTLEESKTEAKGLIAAELAKYDKTAYTTNGEELDTAAEAAEAAVDAAQDFAAVNAAVANCKAALAAVVKDADIEAARTDALNALKAKYPATAFTITGLTGNDEKYNNKSLYEAKIVEVTEALAGKNSGAEMKVVTDAADTYLAGITDAVQLTAKKTAAVTELKAHKTAEELAEFKTAYPAEGAKIDAILADEGEGSAVVKINACTTIAAVNTALNKAKADIDSIIDDADEDPATVIAGCQDDLETYGNTKKTEYTAIADAIEQAVTAGKTEIGNAADLEGTDEEKKTAARNAYDEACAAIDLIVAKHEAKQAVAAYGEQVITDNSLTDTDLLAAIRGIDTTAIDNATSETVNGKTDEVKTAIDLLVVKYNAKLTIAEYKTTKKAEVVGRDDVKEDIDNVEMTEIDAVTKEADITDAINKVKAKIDRIVSDLYNSYVQVTVDGYGAVNVKYGSKLTEAGVYVTGMNVTAVYTDAGKATPIPEEGLTVYSATTVYVDIEDGEDVQTSVTWKVTDETDIANITSNDLFAITSTGGEAYKAVSTSVGGVAFTKAWHTTNIESRINKNTKEEREVHDNKATPIVINVKVALSSLKVYLKLSDSNGTGNNRYGTIFASVNGGEYVSIKTANSNADMSVAHVFENLNAGDLITIYADVNGENGARLFLFGADAALDTSKVPKLVTVEWLNGDGTVWKTTTHSYLDTITAPEGSPTVNGAFTGWQYNGADLSADLTLASSSTAYQMTPKAAAPDITINYTDGTPAAEPLKYLSSAQGNELPAPENGDATHLFLGYYLQAGDEPADTDTVFDLSAAAAGTYTVYAKYLEANVTIVYKADSDDAGETVKLFKKADGSLVTADGKAATLKAAPTAPADKPEFKGWVYTVEDEEVTLDLTALKAGDTITVTAKFAEKTTITRSIKASALTDYKSGDQMNTGTADSNSHYAITGNSDFVVAKDGKVKYNTNVGGQVVFQTDGKSVANKNAIAISCKAGAITVTVKYAPGTNNFKLDILDENGNVLATDPATSTTAGTFETVTLTISADKFTKEGFIYIGSKSGGRVNIAEITVVSQA